MNTNKKYFVTLCAAMFCIISGSFSQITFEKTFGGTSLDAGNSVTQTTDGGYIIAGYSKSFGGGSNEVYLIRTNSNGDTLWTKTLGGAGSDNSQSVKQTPDGGFIISGSYVSPGNDLNGYLIKTDSSGNVLWSKIIGGAGFENSNDVYPLSDGGYIVAGYTSSSGAGSNDVLLFRTNSMGDTLWTKTYGGSSNDVGLSTLQTIDGGYIVAGYTNSFNAGDFDVYLIKVDTAGNITWSKTLGGNDDDFSFNIQQTTDSGYIICGYTQNPSLTNSKVLLLKTDASGNLLWTKTFGGTNTDYSHCVKQTSDGGYIITGMTGSFGVGNSDVYLIKTDSIGNLIWTKTFGAAGSDYANSVSQTTDGGYIITGATDSYGSGSLDVYLIKTDSAGNTICNNQSVTSIASTPVMHVTTPATLVSSGVVIANATTFEASGSLPVTICTLVGIHEPPNKLPYSISPNPSAGFFTINFTDAVYKGFVEISSISGKKVFSKTIYNASAETISLKNIPGGIYFVKILNGDQLYCSKIIVEYN